MKASVFVLGRGVLIALLAVVLPVGAEVEKTMSVADWVTAAVDSGDNLAVTAVTVEQGQTVFYERGARQPGGPAVDRHTHFEIGSVTKAFTNLLLVDMVASGKVAYDTTLAELLPDADGFANPEVGQITLEQLATHHSGLPRLPANLSPNDPADPYRGYDEGRLLSALASTRARQPLGRHYAYSNFGAGLLGYLLGEVDGRGYQRALAARVLSPLGLSSTGFSRSENRVAGFRNRQVVADWSLDDALAGAGGLISNAAELAVLGEALLATPAALDAPVVNAAEQVVANTDIGFQLTRVWHVAKAAAGPVYWHNGGTGGFFSIFAYQPATERSLAILVSGEQDPTAYALAWFAADAEQLEVPAPDETLVGQYALTSNIGIGVFVQGDQLLAQVSGQAALPLKAVDDDWYAYEHVDASLHFVREQGKVVALELAQGGRLQQAPRTADEAEVAQRASVALSLTQLDEFVGEYVLAPGMVFTLRRRGEQLEAMLTGQSFLPIYPESQDVFYYKVVDAELHFERDANNRVNALVLHQGAVKQRAAKQIKE